MTGSGPLLDHATILAFLNDVAADEALAGTRRDLVIVGGSYMALTDLDVPSSGPRVRSRRAPCVPRRGG